MKTNAATTPEASARGEWMRDYLESERWSQRRIELRTGIKKDRMGALYAGGEPRLTEIAGLAPLFGMDATQFIAKLLSFETDDNGNPHGGASTRSNIIAADFTAKGSGMNQGYVPSRAIAPVVPLFAAVAR